MKEDDKQGMRGFVPASELDRLLKMGYGFMGAKSGCCDWKVELDDSTLEIQALAHGHDAVPGLFRVYSVEDPAKGLMRLAPSVTMELTVSRRRRNRFQRVQDKEIIHHQVFDKLDDFVDVAYKWVVEGKMKVELSDMIKELP